MTNADVDGAHAAADILLSTSTRGYVPHADGPTVDQRGVERPQGALVDGQRRCDIGAVER